MSQESKTTTDHDVIRRWAEERGGRPAAVQATHDDDDVGIIRIAFDDGKEELDIITWEELFEKFEEQKLAFLYQNETKGGGTSRFFKFVKR
ncbi:MAG: hypothetical protein IPM60_04195 [Rhodospirillales bacterium]|nr:hypothetical protein [Rhodospirillales bacterium]